MNETGDLLSDLLLAWEESRESGQEATPEELAQGNPHLVEELRKKIAVLKATEWMDHPTSTNGEPSAPIRNLQHATINDRYRIHSFIGSGGHASVWLARDLRLDRLVAIKIPHGAYSSGRLQAEARRVAMLKHPRIVPVYDFGTWDGFDFIVSEFVEGASLDRVASRRDLPFARTREIIRDVAEALDCAHRQGLIHLDVKPSNIPLDPSGRARLCDFGIAVSGEGKLPGVTGTLQYMAPEQLAGQRVSPQTDVYALGVLLHYLCTGKVPYAAKNPVELQAEIIRGQIVWADTLPPKILKVCQRAMQPEPRRRFQRATELAEMVGNAGNSHSRLLVALVAAPLLVGPYWATTHFLARETPAEVRIPALEDAWLARIRALPADGQVTEVQAELVRRNPGLTDPGNAIIENGVVRRYHLITAAVTDISPVRGFPELEGLFLDGTRTGQPNGKLADLSPLAGMRIKMLGVAWNPRLRDLGPLRDLPLESLNCVGCGVEDLSPLVNTSLKELMCGGNPIRDLSPLRGLKLDLFHCNKTQVRDLSPLGGMGLRVVRCQETPVDSLEPLRGQPLHLLECHNTNISDLAPLSGSPFLWNLSIGGTRVTDLSPLKTLPQLTSLELYVPPGQEQSLLATLPKLVELNKRPVQEYLKVNEIVPDPVR